MQGLDAAYVVFSWEEVTLSIQNECPQKENRINSDLQPIILEAMRIKDEAADEEDAIPSEEEETIDETMLEEDPPDSPTDMVKSILQRHVGERCGLEDIYQDNSMQNVVATVAALGDVLRFGRLKVCYLDRSEAHDMIILPGDPSTSIVVNPKCPRDKIIQVLCDYL